MFGVTPLNLREYNSYHYMQMQSSEDADRLIARFAYYIKRGYDPNAVYEDVFRECRIDENDLTDEDALRIKEAVENIYHRVNG